MNQRPTRWIIGAWNRISDLRTLRWFHFRYVESNLCRIKIDNGTVLWIRFGYFQHATSRFVLFLFFFLRTRTDDCFFHEVWMMVLLPVAIWGLCYFMWFVFCSALWLRMCRSWWWFGWSLLKYIEEPEESSYLGLKSAHTITDKNPTPCQDWTVYDSTNNGSNQIQWNNIIFVYNGVQGCGFVILLQYWLTSAQL